MLQRHGMYSQGCTVRMPIKASKGFLVHASCMGHGSISYSADLSAYIQCCLDSVEGDPAEALGTQ